MITSYKKVFRTVCRQDKIIIVETPPIGWKKSSVNIS